MKPIAAAACCLLACSPAMANPAFPLAAFLIDAIANAPAPAPSAPPAGPNASMNRNFPENARLCSLGASELPAAPYIAIDGARVPVSPAARIKDAQNRFLLLGQMPQSQTAVCLIDQGQLIFLWLPSDAELAKLQPK